MTYALSWLGTVLRAAGCTVVETVGWHTRGHGDFGEAKGILIHHTAGAPTGDMPSLKTLINGRIDLIGPLCNLGLSREGTFYIVAAGRAYHAGAGEWQGVTNGNSELIGIECENTGLPDDPWPDVQMAALRKGCNALRKHIGASPLMVAGHKEFALPHGRKVDPSFSMPDFRASLTKGD